MPRSGPLGTRDRCAALAFVRKRFFGNAVFSHQGAAGDVCGSHASPRQHQPRRGAPGAQKLPFR